MVNQQMIADKAGFDRSTITKILNKDPGLRVNPATRERVLALAKKMGYDYSRLRRIHRRLFERKKVNLESEITVYTKDGRKYDSGFATIRDISPAGALLSNVRLPGGALPLDPFTIKLIILEGKLKNIEAEVEVIRFQREKKTGTTEMGTKFIRLTRQDRKNLQKIIEDI